MDRSTPISGAGLGVDEDSRARGPGSVVRRRAIGTSSSSRKASMARRMALRSMLGNAQSSAIVSGELS